MIYCSQCGTGNLDGTRFCNSCGSSLTATVAVNKSPEKESAQPADPLLGRTIEGKYRFDAKLGEGGMGAVYKATRMLIGDIVAIKVLHGAQSATAQAGERFRREAQAAARLKHPNAVAIYDFGVTGDGLLYLIMELAEGQSLRSLIKEKGAIPPQMAAEIMGQACSALDEAHQHNIVHRDIKPDNIMVRTTSGGMQVKVLDFGIAKLRDLTGSDTLTQHGSVIGTPHYMSPEQCLGEELDGRSDIYSLGVVLYEMLSGVAPFRGNTSREIITKHITQPPPSIRSINASLSPEVDAVLQQVLEKDRDARPQTASVLVKMLNNALKYAGPPQTAPQPVPHPPPQHPVVPTNSGQVPYTPTPPPITIQPTYPPPYQTGPQPKKRGWFLPFLIGGVIMFIVIFFILMIIGLMVGDESKNRQQPATVASLPTPTTGPSVTARASYSTPPPAQPVSQPTPEPAPARPLQVRATASSTRAAYRGLSYAPEQALDGSMLTAWVEGAPGPGIGQWVQ